MKFNIDDPKQFTKVLIDDVIKTPTKSGDYTLVKNSWWIKTPDNCILYYRGYSRQCNRDKRITESFLKNYENCNIIFLENVWEKYRD